VVGDALVIRIDNLSFSPAELRLPRGGKVMWINADDVLHLIASADGRFRTSGARDTGGQYVLSLDTPGTYPYFCTLHPRMTGRIVVT